MPPFHENSIALVVDRITEGAVNPIGSMYSKQLEILVLKMLSKRPEVFNKFYLLLTLDLMNMLGPTFH